jgi:hypothetical protein
MLRSWRSVMFAPIGDGQRRRRGSDGVRLAVAVLALGCCLLVIRFESRMDRVITEVFHPPLWSIDWLVTVVYQGGSLGVVLVLVTLAVVARRWEIARDIAVFAAVATAALPYLPRRAALIEVFIAPAALACAVAAHRLPLNVGGSLAIARRDGVVKRHDPRPDPAGVSESDAAAVFIQRLFTSYLPPIWGWAVLVWMREKDYL